jgi:hypothetical protein
MKPLIFRPNEKERVRRVVEYWLSALAQGREYVLEVKQHRKKRSLDSNAYFWLLAHKLAAKTGEPVTEYYQRAIREIGGVSEHYCGKPEAIARLCKIWESNGLGWTTEVYDSKVPGCVNAILYYGSSSFDTKQMSHLIDFVVQDCKAMEIETLTPEELTNMIGKWDAKINEGNGDTTKGQGSSLGA